MTYRNPENSDWLQGFLPTITTQEPGSQNQRQGTHSHSPNHGNKQVTWAFEDAEQAARAAHAAFMWSQQPQQRSPPPNMGWSSEAGGNASIFQSQFHHNSQRNYEQSYGNGYNEQYVNSAGINPQYQPAASRRSHPRPNPSATFQARPAPATAPTQAPRPSLVDPRMESRSPQQHALHNAPSTESTPSPHIAAAPTHSYSEDNKGPGRFDTPRPSSVTSRPTSTSFSSPAPRSEQEQHSGMPANCSSRNIPKSQQPPVPLPWKIPNSSATGSLAAVPPAPLTFLDSGLRVTEGLQAPVPPAPPMASSKQRRPPAPGHRRPDQGQPPPAKKRRLDHGHGHPAPAEPRPFQVSQYAYKSPSRSHIKLRTDLVQRLDPKEAAVKEAYDPSTIARDVLIIAAKHPTEKPLNHHLERLRKNLSGIEYSSDLDTFRWDLVDPVKPPGQKGNAMNLGVKHTSTPATQLNNSPKVTWANSSAAPPPPLETRPPKPASSFGTISFKPPPFTSRPSSHPPRPPLPSALPSNSPRVQPPAPFSTSTPTLTSKPETPVVPSQPSLGPAASSPRAQGSLQPQVMIPPSPNRMPAKRRPGRPRKSENVEVAVPAPPTSLHYPVFPCQWTGCSAQLHNLEMLQKHIVKLHIPHHITCAWQGCADSTPIPAATMCEHVFKTHVEPLAWKLGDGPAAPTTVDETKKQPSQSILWSQSAGRDIITVPADTRMLRAYSKVHGAKKSVQKALAYEAGGLRWKEEVGPEVDKAGRKLATPARQGKHSRDQPEQVIMPL